MRFSIGVVRDAKTLGVCAKLGPETQTPPTCWEPDIRRAFSRD